METITKNYNPAMSDDITKLACAFLLAKKDFRATGLGGTNAHQKYNYAKVGDIYQAVEGALSMNNIIIWHFARPNDNGIEYLYTRLIHTPTGQFIEDCRILESEKSGNQAKGAANTYMKKYAVLSLCAIATEDDDGEEEEKHIAEKTNQQYLTHDDVTEIIATIKTAANAKTLHDLILTTYKVQSLNQLPYSSYDAVKLYIEKNRK